MAAPAGGAPPPPSGGNGDEPWKNPRGRGKPNLPPGIPWAPLDNEHNKWRINTKIKTCKCSLCSERVTKASYSFQCLSCLFHICKDCAEPDGASAPTLKANAHFQFIDRCKCRYPSKRTPAFSRWKDEHHQQIRPPPMRSEENRRNKDTSARGRIDQTETEAATQADGSLTDAGPSGLRDDAFRGPPPSRPTIASNRRDRNLKRKDYRDPDTPSESEASEQPTSKKSYRGTESTSKAKLCHDKTSVSRVAKQSTKDAASLQHLQGGTTVIVGAGIVGLCVARELATELRTNRTEHRIIVVDIQDKYCRMASGECSGLLSIDHASEKINGLAELSRGCWGEMFRSAGADEVFKLARFRQSSVYHVRNGPKNDHEHKPSWYIGKNNETFEENPQTIGKFDTRVLVSFLYEQCLREGVEFRFNQRINSIFKVSTRDVGAVSISGLHEDSGSDKVYCQNLVLAAGPFTSHIFRCCYRKTKTVDLENNIQHALWHEVPQVSMPNGDDVGVLLPDVARTSNSLEDKVTAVAQPTRLAVRVAAVTKARGEGHLSRTDALNPQMTDPVPLRQLERLAMKIVDGGGLKAHDTRFNTQGFSFISTSRGGLPVIDKVPASKLGIEDTGEKAADSRPDGLWVCFGFGMYGTALAPGAARALVRRMLGKPSGIVDAHFSA